MDHHADGLDTAIEEASTAKISQRDRRGSSERGVPAAVSTGTPSISSPPTLPEPPGEQLTAHKQAAATQ